MIIPSFLPLSLPPSPPLSLSSPGDGEFDDDSDSENDYENVIPLRQNVVMRQKSDTRPNRIGGEGHIGLKRRSASFKKVQRQRRQAETREQKVRKIQVTLHVLQVILIVRKAPYKPKANLHNMNDNLHAFIYY